MKKILTPKLTLQYGELPRAGSCPGLYEDDDGHWLFCHDELLEIFDLPSGTDTIQFEARSERFPGSMKVKFGSIVLYGMRRPMVTLEDAGRAFLFPRTDNDVDAVIGKRRRTWYVKLHYWE